MSVKIAESWKKELEPEFEKEYFKSLTEFIKEDIQNNVVYPPGKLIFNAFEKCSFDNTKVVILGQDPYHGKGQANGLSFSVSDGVRIPPSLQNIFKEINDDLGKEIPKSGNLERWAEQGVLLLNSISDSPFCHARLSSEKRLGNFYRCRDQNRLRPKRRSGFYALGEICATERSRN